MKTKGRRQSKNVQDNPLDTPLKSLEIIGRAWTNDIFTAPINKYNKNMDKAKQENQNQKAYNDLNKSSKARLQSKTPMSDQKEKVKMMEFAELDDKKENVVYPARKRAFRDLDSKPQKIERVQVTPGKWTTK